MAQTVKRLPAMRETQVQNLLFVTEHDWRDLAAAAAAATYWKAFPGGSDGQASACNVGDPGSKPALCYKLCSFYTLLVNYIN